MNDCEIIEVSKVFSNAAGLVPHLLALIDAVGFLGLEPRVRQLGALAVARSAKCKTMTTIHALIGKTAGLTKDERKGAVTGLTRAELSAVALALGTVSRSPEGLESVDFADQHLTPEEIRQLQAVALAVDLDCQIFALVRGLIPRSLRG